MHSLPVLSTTKLAPRSVRLSITDRCDLACIYCRPHRNDGYLRDRLDLAAWKTMVRGLVSAGVRRVRLTGGEPLLHRSVLEIVEFLASLGLEDLALTTNATFLEPLAVPLKAAGLSRLTVSLDSLDAACFSDITRGGSLARVLAGIEAARATGFEEIKINCVVLRGINDHELPSLVDWSWKRAIVPRFIEVMPIGEGHKVQDLLVPVAEMRERLRDHLAEEPGAVDPDRGPAVYVRGRRGEPQRVGFISGTTHTFCDACDRLRVTADGSIRPCLATNDSVQAAKFAKNHDAHLVHNAINQAWERKPDGTSWKGCTEPSAREVSMRATGG